ncbi:MAG: hypothetical protein IEMM0008_1125 [bacterium]|nr:MAG: hypothetical protein IEMM0008_1125 [bacterium]
MKTPEKDFGQQHKDLYIINLDMTRVFWLLAVGLFMITFFFLFGYWLGSDPDHIYSENSLSITKTHQSNLVAINKSDVISSFDNKKTLRAAGNYANHPSGRNVNNENNATDTETQGTQVPNNQTAEPSSDESSTDQSLSQSKRFTIQVSANRVAENARRLKDKLHDKGFNAYIYKINRNNGLFYFVRVGSFASENRARQTLRRLRSIKHARGSRIVNR